MTEHNKISAEDIIDSWSASAHMATAIEYLHDACNSSYISTQIQNMEGAIEAIRRGTERLKGNPEKQKAAGESVKFLRAEISRLRKKLQRGVKTEVPNERAKKTLLDKEIKRIHKGVKKEKKETKKQAKKEKKLLGKLEKTGSSAHDIIEQTFLGNPSLRKANEQLEKFTKDSGPVIATAGKKLVDAFVEGTKKINKQAKKVFDEKATATAKMKDAAVISVKSNKPKAPKKSGSKKGKK